jgi:hypothetical protein
MRSGSGARPHGPTRVLVAVAASASDLSDVRKVLPLSTLFFPGRRSRAIPLLQDVRLPNQNHRAGRATRVRGQEVEESADRLDFEIESDLTERLRKLVDPSLSLRFGPEDFSVFARSERGMSLLPRGRRPHLAARRTDRHHNVAHCRILALSLQKALTEHTSRASDRLTDRAIRSGVLRGNHQRPLYKSRDLGRRQAARVSEANENGGNRRPEPGVTRTSLFSKNYPSCFHNSGNSLSGKN